MLTAEPTGGVVWNGCRGAITLRVDVRGREAHVGYANTGVNAFEHMLRVAQPLTTLAHELFERDSMLVVGGMARPGANFNVVPGSAGFWVDRRFNPDEDLDAEVARLTDAIDAAAGDADVSVESCSAHRRRAPTRTTRPRSRSRVRRRGRRGRAACSSCARACWRRAGTRSSASPRSLMAVGGSTSRMGRRSTSTRSAMRRCAAVYALYGATMH